MIEPINLFGLPADGGIVPSEDSPYNELLQTFWVLEGHNIPWAHLTMHLDRLLIAPAMVVLYEPWWPKREQRRKAFARILGSRAESSDRVCLALVPDGRSVSVVFKAYEECGAHNSGRWLLVAPHGSVDILVGRLRGGLEDSPGMFAATIASHLLCALALDEGGQGDLFVRRNHAAFASFEALLEELGVNHIAQRSRSPDGE